MSKYRIGPLRFRLLQKRDKVVDYITRHINYIRYYGVYGSDVRIGSRSLIARCRKKKKPTDDPVLYTVWSRVEHYAKIIGTEISEVKLKKVYSYWGKCTYPVGVITINRALLYAPVGAVDAVIVHELCHLTIQNHSEALYKDIYTIMPDYDRWLNWLKDNGYRLLTEKHERIIRRKLL